MESITMEILPRLRPVTNFMSLASAQVQAPLGGLQEVLQSEVLRLKNICHHEVRGAHDYYANQAQSALRHQQIEFESYQRQVVREVHDQVTSEAAALVQQLLENQHQMMTNYSTVRLKVGEA